MKYGWTPGATQAPPDQYVYHTDFYAQQQLRKGMQVAFVGLALLIGLGFIGYRGDGSFVYGPWLLGGLIPLFVGVAQIIGAVLGGASFGSAGTRQRFDTSGGTEQRPRRERLREARCRLGRHRTAAGGRGRFPKSRNRPHHRIIAADPKRKLA